MHWFTHVSFYENDCLKPFINSNFSLNFHLSFFHREKMSYICIEPTQIIQLQNQISILIQLYNIS